MYRSSCSSNNWSIDSSRNTMCNSNSYMRYGNCYVPDQVLNTVFSPMDGLANGSMFPELVMPYSPGQSLDEMNYLRYGNRGGLM